MRNGFSEQQNESHRKRHERVLLELTKAESRNILDIGCGDGQLLQDLFISGNFSRLAGIDISEGSLKEARQHLSVDIELRCTSVMTMSERYRDFDAAVLVEVIEHIPLLDLAFVTDNIFGNMRPETVIITTPNAAEGMRLPPERLRDLGHYFEWDAAEFGVWGNRIEQNFYYEFKQDLITGPSFKRGTHIGIFSRRD